jgi:hypothetical protein
MTFETEGSEYDSDVEEHQNKKKDNSLTCKIKINEEYAKLLKKPKPRGIVLPKYDLGYTYPVDAKDGSIFFRFFVIILSLRSSLND